MFEYSTLVDCDAKSVILRLADGYEVVVVGENDRFFHRKTKQTSRLTKNV